MQQPYNMMQPPQKDMSPAQANMTAMNQTAARNVAMQGAKSQNAPAMVSGKEVMQRPPTLQPTQSGQVSGQAIKTGVNPENRNIKQTTGTGIIAAQMNRPA
tara:strand:+ start:220 stop:522 length:303 start_codon:yes stop_codon:yes gene_type:complete